MLLRFRNSNRHSYPGIFSDDHPHGKGGGIEAWEKILDEMIFSFEFIVYHELVETKKGKEFWLKYYNETPWDNFEKNKNFSYHYYMKTKRESLSHWMSSGKKLSEEECKERNCELRHTEEYYRDWELEKLAEKRAQKGLMLFAKYFRNLWD